MSFFAYRPTLPVPRYSAYDGPCDCRMRRDSAGSRETQSKPSTASKRCTGPLSLCPRTACYGAVDTVIRPLNKHQCFFKTMTVLCTIRLVFHILTLILMFIFLPQETRKRKGLKEGLPDLSQYLDKL